MEAKDNDERPKTIDIAAKYSSIDDLAHDFTQKGLMGLAIKCHEDVMALEEQMRPIAKQLHELQLKAGELRSLGARFHDALSLQFEQADQSDSDFRQVAFSGYMFRLIKPERCGRTTMTRIDEVIE